MPLDPKKISAVAELTNPDDADFVPVIDDSAASPATKGKRLRLSVLLQWIVTKIGVPSKVAAEAGEETVPRLMTMERLRQAIIALAPAGQLHHFTASNPPTGADDNTAGYGPGSLWMMPTRVWVCRSALTNIAVWIELTGGSGGEGGLDEAAVNLLIAAANPTTTAGDLIVRGASALERLAIGADGKVLGIVAGALAWVTPSGGGGGSGMENPMTTAGDLIVGGAAGAPARLAQGTDGKVLGVVDGAIDWVTPSGGGAPGPLGTVLHAESRALVIGDAGRLHLGDGGMGELATNPILEMPQQSVVAWPDGTVLWFRKTGGEQDFAVSNGTSVSGAAITIALNETVALARIGTNAWTVLYRWSSGA